MEATQLMDTPWPLPAAVSPGPVHAPSVADAPTARSEVDALALVLLDAWKKAEPDSSVTKYPTSYLATFVDMARAALAAAEAQPDHIPDAGKMVAVPQGSASLATLQGEAQVLRALLADALPWFDEAAADQPDPEALPHLQALRDRIRAALAPTPGTLL
jgi:hypothetical protein